MRKTVVVASPVVLWALQVCLCACGSNAKDGGRPVASDAGDQAESDDAQGGGSATIADDRGSPSEPPADSIAPVDESTELDEEGLSPNDDAGVGQTTDELSSGAGGATGVGGASGNEGVGGQSSETAGCEEQEVRCGPSSGVRELCAAGEWVEQDFVCAVEIRVEDSEGTSCAVKSDGSYGCWALGGDSIKEPEEPPGPIDVVFPVPSPGGGELAWLLSDGTFVDAEGNETPGVTDMEVGIGPDYCLILDDKSASCSLSGVVGASPVVKLATSSTMRCALLETGDVYCDDRHENSVTLYGGYVAIAVAYQTLCAIDGSGTLTCAYLSAAFDDSDEPTYLDPLDGVYKQVAMIDTHVCAIARGGELECSKFTGEDFYDQPGLFTDIAGGDFVFSAIRQDGSILSWLNGTVSKLPDGW